MKYGCIGEHLSHSFSKEIHNMLAEYEYELCEVAREDLDSFMKNRDFCAINVTIPYKSAVIPYLYSISERAKKIGAVNTVVNRDGRLYGYNTDFPGMIALIEKLGLDLEGKKVLILGTGGTSLTALAVASELGAKEIYRVSRDPSGDGQISYVDALSIHKDAKVIINTTPCGMYPGIHASPIDVSPESFPVLEGVVDVVYNPLSSKMVLAARKRDAVADGGLYMLVAQAAFAVEHFIDAEIERSKIDDVYAKILQGKRNIVLVGMPGSGKSTVGRALSEVLGRRFYDTDEMIVQSEGVSIADIFRERGEHEFRRIESLAVCETVAPLTSAVISTGGGAVLDPKNVEALRHNGKIYFLDRPLSQIMPTDDRPLSSDRDALVKRYNERYGIYTSCADVRIDASGSVDDVVNAILRDFQEK